METLILVFPEIIYTTYSDPTYEAWKPSLCMNIYVFSILFRSYLRGMETRVPDVQFILNYEDSDPTYEAWKPPPETTILSGSANSDPTYEAWKQIFLA